MKKQLLTLGTLVTLGATIIAPIACGSNQTTQDAGTDTTNGLPNDPKTNTPSVVLPFTDQDIKDDSIILTKDSYKGSLWNGTLNGGSVTGDAFKVLPSTTNTFAYNNVVPLGDGDSFYVAFDNDDTDGLSVNDFEKEFFLCDSSYSSTPVLDSVNQQLGNSVQKAGGWKELRVGFANGESNQWFGSQTNHLFSSWDDQMKILKSTTSDAIYTSIENYYKTASHLFVPVAQPKKAFTYEKVKDNVMKVTFHYHSANLNPITQAMFYLVNQNDSKITKYSPFSLGDINEWRSYMGHSEATYFAVQDEMLKP